MLIPISIAFHNLLMPPDFEFIHCGGLNRNCPRRFMWLNAGPIGSGITRRYDKYGLVGGSVSLCSGLEVSYMLKLHPV